MQHLKIKSIISQMQNHACFARQQEKKGLTLLTGAQARTGVLLISKLKRDSGINGNDGYQPDQDQKVHGAKDSIKTRCEFQLDYYMGDKTQHWI